ncbi:hypothetical protein ACWEQO_10825 [Streptomyces sp. NPDC004051]
MPEGAAGQRQLPAPDGRIGDIVAAVRTRRAGPGHGTSTGTRPATNTGNPSDRSRPGGSGGGDQDSGNDTDQ